MKWIGLLAVSLVSVGLGLMINSIGLFLATFGVGLGMWVFSIEISKL